MGSFLAIGSAIISAGLCITACYESYALITGKVPPITSIVRDKISANPHSATGISALIGLIIGWLIGHLGKY